MKNLWKENYTNINKNYENNGAKKLKNNFTILNKLFVNLF